MKRIGTDIYIQRGETWSLDVDITNERGDPYMVFSKWRNPYLAITVSAARYAQKGDFRHTYWLDLNERYEEQEDGSVLLVPMKKFVETRALMLDEFTIDEAITTYGLGVGGKMVIDKNSDFDVTNYLFFCDPKRDGNLVYKYVKGYQTNTFGAVISENWEEYNFRMIKSFNTLDWIEQKYLFDIKILSGESVEEGIENTLLSEETEFEPRPWDSDKLLYYANAIKNETTRDIILRSIEEGIPLMPNYDTKALILPPTNLFVSANIQGGV